MTYSLLIALMVLISYFRAIVWGEYTIDDEDVFNLDRTPKNKWQKLWWQAIGKKYSNPQTEHLINVATHLINCELIYFAFGRNNISFLTALLFAVNPAGTQGSVWLSGKGYAISTMFVLLMWWLCPIFYLITPYLSLNAIFAPLLFIRTQWWLILLIPIYLYIAKGEKVEIKRRLSTATGKGQEFSPVKIIIALKTLGYYTCLAVFPTRLGIYHSFLWTYSLSKVDNDYWEKIDKFFWIGCLVLGLLFYGWFWHYNNAVFGLFWFVLFLAQWTNIITLSQSIAERYIYLPLIGMSYCVVNLIMALPDITLRIVVFTVLFMYYWTRLQLIIPMYYNIHNCIDYGRLNFPDLYVYYTWLGQIEKRRGSFFTALEAWFHGFKMRPVDFRLNNNIAVMLTNMGYLDDAEAFLKNAETNIIPEQKKAADMFIAHERERIAKARQILKDKEIAKRIILPKYK